MSPAHWFFRHWVHTCLPIAVILIVLAPLLAAHWPPALVLVFLLLPAYMIHQYEEHNEDRFKHFVTGIFGREVLDDTAIFWVNILLVWVLMLVVLYLAVFGSPVWGLISIYLVLFNGAGHIVGSIVLRRPNPGVWTSLLLFLPLGGMALFLTITAYAPSAADHLVGIAVTVLGHAGIIGIAAANRARRAAT